MTALAPVLEAFFTERLAQRQASPHTVASYRDTFCLLLRYAQQRLGKPPSRLDLADLGAPFIGAFLDHLETGRGNSIATRNNRLAAIHSLFAYAALRCPEHAALISRVLAIPGKRAGTTIVAFLTRAEASALLASPDRRSWLGRRDHALLLVAVQTGLRVSELTGLDRGDVTLGTGANLRCRGKGRKQRCTPLTTTVAQIIADWLSERDGQPADPLFPGRTGRRLSRDAVEDLLARHVTAAATRCPSLNAKNVTPHTLRHTAAMNLLQAGVDTSTIALWLGHAGTQATQVYLHADLALKEAALARTFPAAASRVRYRPPDHLLAFLEGL
jgi:site-specific recombinase XerD